jgi:uncharacterized protein with HEPN domain
MARKVGHAIHDILEAIERIEEITQGRSLADFEASWQLGWLVQRAIEIISEASRAIPDELRTRGPRFRGVEYAESATCCGMTTRAYRIAFFGMSLSMSCLA